MRPNEKHELPVRLSRRAESDLEDLFLYYWVEGGEALVARFLAAFEYTAQTLANYPELGAVLMRGRGSRPRTGVLPVQEPFRSILIYYQLSQGTPFILRIAHGAQLVNRLLEDE